MRYRTYPNSSVTVSEVGFGLWTTATDWWGKKSEAEATALLHEAFDLGVTLFDAADVYGNGRSEEQLAAGGAIARETLVGEQLVDRRGRKGLARVDDLEVLAARAERLEVLARFGGKAVQGCGGIEQL